MSLLFKSTFSKLPSRRSFHTNIVVFEEWTKASLRRMKKVELTRLARENNLKLSGTKNDIIIQLLTHQTAKIVGSTTPSIQTIQKVIQEEAPLVDEIEVDGAWVNAFEQKVAQRGSRKPMDTSHDHFTSGTPSKPHPFNDQLKAKTLILPTETKPKPEFSVPAVPIISAKTVKFEPKSVTTTEELEGIDPQWVEAFDLKVGSRGGARRQLTDTLSPSTPPTKLVDALEFITFDEKANEEHKPVVGKKFDHVKKHTEKHETQHYHNNKKHEHVANNDSKTEEKKSSEHSYIKHNGHANKNTDEQKNNGNSAENKEHNTDTNNNSSDNSRETWINTAVGSSMFIWYYGEGLSKIWHFLTSSS